MKYCPNCGAQINDNEKVCPVCGSYIEDENVSMDQWNNSYPQNQWNDNNNYVTNMYDQPPVNNYGAQNKEVSNKTFHRFIIVLLVLIIATVAGGGTYMYFTLNGNTTSASSSKTSNSKTSKSKSNSSSSNTVSGSAEESAGKSDNTTTEDSEDSEELYKIDVDDSSFIFPDSETYRLTDDQVTALDLSNTRTAINEIYARHQYSFRNTTDQYNYFKNNYSWYVGNNSDLDAVEGTFTKIEKANVDKLAAHRALLREQAEDE